MQPPLHLKAHASEFFKWVLQARGPRAATPRQSPVSALSSVELWYSTTQLIEEQPVQAGLAVLPSGQVASSEVDLVTGQVLKDWGSLVATHQYATKGARMTQLTEDNQGIGGVTTRAGAEL